ncbi:hypothetical protein EV122DRAFT_227056, partial [Schizophyllum commune]
ARKLKCDGGRPSCANCEKKKFPCNYVPVYVVLFFSLYAMSITPSQRRQGKEVDAALMATILPRRRQHLPSSVS